MQKLELCPKCSHIRSGRNRNQKCLSIDTVTGMFKCHHPHCDYQGRMKGYSGNEPILPKPKPKIVVPDTDYPDWMVTIFKARGISIETLKRNKVACNGREIMFVYHRDGKPVNVKYRSRDKKYRQEAGGAKIFYGLDDIKDCKEAIIVEGEPDKLAIEEASYQNVLSVPDGAPDVNTKNYISKFSYIENCEEELDKIDKFIIAVDNDSAGKKLETELIRRLGPEKCYTVQWPEGCKDANQVLVERTMYDLVSAIEEARPVPISGIFEVPDFENELDKLYHNNGRECGLSTGWLGADRLYTIRPGEVTVVTGIPSHGKSEIVDAIMVNLAYNHDWRFATFSPENHPIELHASKIIQKHIGKPFSKSYSGFMNTKEFEASKPWVDEHFKFIAPRDDELRVDSIIEKAIVCVKRYGIKGLSCDPWNEFDHSRPSGMTETEYISLALTKVRRFARTYKVHVWLVAHPTKLQKNNKDQYPVPTPYDISGSANWRNKPDNCLSIWRDLADESKEVEFYVQKVRFREIGKIGMAKLRYNINSGRYTDV